LSVCYKPKRNVSTNSIANTIPRLHWYWITGSTVATGRHGAHPAPAVLGHWIRADPKFFWGDRGDGRRSRQQTSVEKRLTAANCLYISGFWLRTQISTGAPLPDLAWGLPSRDPLRPTLTSEPGYATDYRCSSQVLPPWLKLPPG